MPVSEGRDLDKTRLALEQWLAYQTPEVDGVSIPELVVPEGNGFSNETLLADLVYRTPAGEEGVRSLVVRLQKPDQLIFPDLDVTRQARVMEQVAAGSSVPVPEVLWIEHDPAVLGTPFFVMEKIDGSIPTDVPSYNEVGFITEMSPDDRRAMWESGIDAMARVHEIDWQRHGLDFLDRPEDGPTGLPQLLAYLQRYQDWAMEGRPHPSADRAWEWLMARVPDETGPAVLCWGDARPSNMIFSGTRCAAVLDWEMAVLGPRELDLAWWLYFDRFSSEGYGVPRLEGLPARDDVIDQYRDLTGHEPRDLRFYEVLAGYYFVLIMVRVAEALHGIGLLDEESDFAVNNTATDLLDTFLDELDA